MAPSTARLDCDINLAEERELWRLENGEDPEESDQRPGAGARAPGAGTTHQLGLETFVVRSANRAGQASAGVSLQAPNSGKVPARVGAVWATVTVKENETFYQPKVKCNNCVWESAAGVTRIKEHILGTNKVMKCTGIITEPLKKLRRDLIDEQETLVAKKLQKRHADEVDLSASGGAGDEDRPHEPLARAFMTGNSIKVEQSIAAFFYAANIPAAVVRAPALSTCLAHQPILLWLTR
jgi:hypothetical protein